MYSGKKLVLSIFWVVLGLTLIALSVLEILDSSMYAGMGGALAAVGSLQIIRNIRYRKNAEYREKIDIEISDERNQFLRMKSWSVTGFVVIVVEGIGVIVAMILRQETIQLVLSYSVCLVLVAYWISYLILSKKY